MATDVGEPESLEGAHDAVVHAALADNSDTPIRRPETLVQPTLADEFHRRRPALRDLLLFVQIGGGRQHDAVQVALRVLQRLRQAHLRALVVARLEAAVHVAGAYAHLKHDRRIGDFRKLEPVAHRLHDRFEVRARVEQPHLALHGEGVAPLLHDRRAFAVILAQDDERAAFHAAGCEIGERVGCDVDADRRLEGHGAADRVVDRGCERRCGGRLRRARFEVHAEIAHDVLRIREHVHQMRDRRALIAANIGDAAFEQRLGDGENAFAAEFLTVADPELLDFLRKRPLSHACRSRKTRTLALSVSFSAERSESREPRMHHRDPNRPSGSSGLRCAPPEDDARGGASAVHGARQP